LDTLYIRLAHGFVYLVAVIDWYSRKVLSWRLSNTLDTGFCVDCLEQALQAHGITISMVGRGRALDNIFVERLWRSVKHEDVYLKGYAMLPELLIRLTEYFAFYNTERLHQSLDYSTPDAVYRSASGGGTIIVDKYTAPGKAHVETEAKNRGSAVPLQVTGDSLNLDALLS